MKKFEFNLCTQDVGMSVDLSNSNSNLYKNIQRILPNYTVAGEGIPKHISCTKYIFDDSTKQLKLIFEIPDDLNTKSIHVYEHGYRVCN